MSKPIEVRTYLTLSAAVGEVAGSRWLSEVDAAMKGPDDVEIQLLGRSWRVENYAVETAIDDPTCVVIITLSAVV